MMMVEKGMAESGEGLPRSPIGLTHLMLKPWRLLELVLTTPRATSLFLIFCAYVNQDLSLWPTIALAFKTLGVVYGDMGTSPLYVFVDVFSKVPIGSNDDILGALSLVMSTISLIPLAKYVFVVLKANDSGEGGTFTLYSLICSSKTASMVIGDGILTPAIAVMPAISGLQDQIDEFGTGRCRSNVCISGPAIQIAFTCVVFPYLLLAYMGQAAFLTKNPSSYASVFYKSVPERVFTSASSAVTRISKSERTSWFTEDSTDRSGDTGTLRVLEDPIAGVRRLASGALRTLVQWIRSSVAIGIGEERGGGDDDGDGNGGEMESTI
ncbi:hypothetical protein JHK85_050911 [Glycine max]|nr:hypothetical protein JHK86_050118 [Glycine max]KAG4935992.1 hypothetical protein JHK85_050911 [Glycine max]